MDSFGKFVDELLGRLTTQFFIDRLYGAGAHALRHCPGQVSRPVEGPLAARQGVLEGAHGRNHVDCTGDVRGACVFQRPVDRFFGQVTIRGWPCRIAVDLLHCLSHANEHR